MFSSSLPEFLNFVLFMLSECILPRYLHGKYDSPRKSSSSTNKSSGHQESSRHNAASQPSTLVVHNAYHSSSAAGARLGIAITWAPFQPPASFTVTITSLVGEYCHRNAEIG